jgi:hypothetical protein
MQLTDKQIREFQAIYIKVFGKTINKQEATTDGMALIRLVSLIQPRKEVHNV